MRVGIDLGTTYSLIARAEGGRKPMLLPDQLDQELYTPSSVYIDQGNAFVGQLAEAFAEQNPDAKIIRFFKRHFGESKPLLFDRDEAAWYPEAVAALVLKKLRFDAEAYAGTPLKGAVITVPAHFNDAQRRSVQAAGALAEVPVLDLLEEPVAAALHYGVQSASNDEVLVAYDFGGGTFDVTVLSMNAKGVYVLAKDGITELGGKELDEKVGEMILDAYERAGIAVDLSARTLLQLRRISEEIKIELCEPRRTEVRRLVLLGDAAVEVRISRADFERAIGDIVEQTIAVLRRCIEEAGLRLPEVNALLLVGGTSMTPLIERRIKGLFSSPGQRVLFHEPTKAVAYGAAYRTCQLAGDAQRYNLPGELRGVTGYHVGVRTIDGSTGAVRVDTVIKKNLPLPARAKRTYYTHRADQTRIMIDLVQFRDASETPVSLGQLTIGPIANPRVNYAVEVTLENQEDGTVAVQAVDPQSGVELTQVFSRDGGGDHLSHLASQRSLVRSIIVNNM